VETIRYAFGACSLGLILVACSEKGIVAILIGDEPDALVRDLQARRPRGQVIGDPALDDLVAEVASRVDAPWRGLDHPLDLGGTPFQQRVWAALRAIPSGCTITYAELAARVGVPGAVRAVAGACAANPIAILVPCHRVLRTDGSLSGYRWGVERKRALLQRENATPAPTAATNSTVPLIF
jgi:AraC family transcriptional regulator, regulatory protein of adaptative response / methylated-DNA-[protein]-cysteine methyltransferase